MITAYGHTYRMGLVLNKNKAQEQRVLAEDNLEDRCIP
jgi:hypothetical protein